MKAVFLCWLILAQCTRWATPWVSWLSWAIFAFLVTAWVCRVPRPGAIRAILATPLSPIFAAAAVSALANGGWWSRVADLALYAVALAWFIDRKPDLDRDLVKTGWLVIGVSLVEWVYLLQRGGGRVHLLGNPNVIAYALGIVLPLGRGWAWWTLGSLAMVATGSRAGLLGLVVYAAREIPRWAGLAVGGVAGILLAIAKPARTLYRVEFFSQAIRSFVYRPIFGVGPGMYRSGDWIHAHNVVLTWMAETGIVGLVGLAISIFLVTKNRSGDVAGEPDLSPIFIISPFFLVDDQTMYWFSALGTCYLLAKMAKHPHFAMAFQSRR